MTQTSKPEAGTVFKMSWDGAEWRAIEFDGEIHLSRVCRYCAETTARVHTRHTVETQTTWERIAQRDASIARLRAIDEHEDADRIEALAGRVL